MSKWYIVFSIALLVCMVGWISEHERRSESATEARSHYRAVQVQKREIRRRIEVAETFRLLSGRLADRLDQEGVDWTNTIEEINLYGLEQANGIEIQIKPGTNVIYNERSGALKLFAP